MKAAYVLSLSLIAMLIAGTAFAQLGEIAGPVNINVSVGSSNFSMGFTIINPTSSPISYYIVLPQFNASTANQIAPTVTITPMNGSVPVHSSIVLNITAYVPSSDSVGVSWTGYALALIVPNASTGGGARIETGVAKTITIKSIKPKPNYLIYEIGAAIAVIVIALVLAVRRLSRRKTTAKLKK